MLKSVSYYTQITTTGTATTGEIPQTGETYTTYSYQQAGYDQDGNEQQLEFMTHPDLNRPFKMQAYLKISSNRLQAEHSYQEVQAADIPDKALAKLNQKAE